MLVPSFIVSLLMDSIFEEDTKNFVIYSVLNLNCIPDHDLGRLSVLSFSTFVKYCQKNLWIWIYAKHLNGREGCVC